MKWPCSFDAYWFLYCAAGCRSRRLRQWRLSVIWSRPHLLCTTAAEPKQRTPAITAVVAAMLQRCPGYLTPAWVRTPVPTLAIIARFPVIPCNWLYFSVRLILYPWLHKYFPPMPCRCPKLYFRTAPSARPKLPDQSLITLTNAYNLLN